MLLIWMRQYLLERFQINSHFMLIETDHAWGVSEVPDWGVFTNTQSSFFLPELNHKVKKIMREGKREREWGRGRECGRGGGEGRKGGQGRKGEREEKGGERDWGSKKGGTKHMVCWILVNLYFRPCIYFACSGNTAPQNNLWHFTLPPILPSHKSYQTLDPH